MIAQLVPVLLAFGANLGDRGETIRAAQAEIAAAAGISEFVASPLRETIALTPDGPDPDAPRYLNGVATAQTTLSPHELLDLTQRVESAHGRTREVRWGARTLDIDVILFGGRVVQDERLTVPHPRAHERDFVLSPWLALDPNAVLMGHGRVAELLARVGDTTQPFDPELGDPDLGDPDLHGREPREPAQGSNRARG
ncbi:2-amino-4-hydroxy-6-hydroxymethyldihydropteridine diphosphokinase [Leucobacter chromiireducens]|uniref:2-amino-4-hydroxy-6-hydroxymethyldihydropteridine diphosphokinase n=1 Tax=Leucobacter chromiireducens subsp. chromiireducens TaxID=660067 RepID=A0ABS1SN85_9MICO|nr:2-amino-4-hydroxy-6-hydroxymethyldihydropteridine diphosphokinase [Leucobacter chromiireducens]MBL3689621.1 2-amino-4-hydroxy-6-hydroxymethyldihydropteridine diphosphokinase [Leucobacter chromiireducens subsp. chromiireducens]